MRDLNEVFDSLARSRFRSRFQLDAHDRAYLADRSREVILEHARQFIQQRLAPAQPANDGRQTPMRGHPAFVAQHATATCCRGCLAKWHDIPKGKQLSAHEINQVVTAIDRWLDLQTTEVAGHEQRRLPFWDNESLSD